MPAQLVARNLSFSHGPVPVLADVDLTVVPGDRIGVVGPNGVGKSTLLRLLTGELAPERGRVERHPASATVVLHRQELDARPGESIRRHVARRTGVADAEAELDAASVALGEGAPGADDRYAAALERYLAVGAADLDVRLPALLDQLGLGGVGPDRPTSGLSGGQRSRVGLVVVAATRADVVLLDEPTNDLDHDGLALLERTVTGTDAGLVVVSHDRTFLERTITAVVEIDGHERRARRFEGGWVAYLEARAVARRHAEEDYADYVTERDRLRGRSDRERRWATTGVGRDKRDTSEPDKNLKRRRIERTEQLAARARRTERAIERLDVVDKPWEGWDLHLSVAAVERSGDVVAELRGYEVVRGEFRLGPVDLVIAFGERVLLAGPNGAGKTTLLAGLLDHLGSSVVVGRLDQARQDLDTDGPLLDAFCERTGATANEARSSLAKLGLGAEHVARPSQDLSPGERTRAVLAAFRVEGVNLLVLDEPTNHLDLPAIEQLEQALDAFDGTLLLVTHDRTFLDAVRITRRIELAAGRIVSDAPAT